MTVEELPEYLKDQWPSIREALYVGCYHPTPVKRVEIPKPGGAGVRMLGILTVLDRLIQQALAQVLGKLFEPHFFDPGWSLLGSGPGFGQVFRPGQPRQAHGPSGPPDADLHVRWCER